jgi:hypothetical protein
MPVPPQQFQATVPAASMNAMPTPPTTSFTPTPVSGGAASPSAPTFAAVPTTNVAPKWQPMLANFTRAFTNIGTADLRKRSLTEKALTALFTKLNANDLPDEVCELLLKFSQLCEVGGAESNTLIRRLTDQYWDQIKPFKDIKFLSK